MSTLDHLTFIAALVNFLTTQYKMLPKSRTIFLFWYKAHINLLGVTGENSALINVH